MRRLLSTSLTVLALFAFSGCDSYADQSDHASTANSGTCSAPSIGSTTIGGYIHVNGYSTFGAVVEASYDGGSSWSHLRVAGTGDSSVNTTLWPWTGSGTRAFVRFRAKNICHDNSTDTYSYSSASSVIIVAYDAEGP